MDLHALSLFLATHAIAALMFATGLVTTTAVVRHVRGRWPLLLRALLVVWVVVPLAALAIVTVLRAPPIATTALLLLAICPGVPLLVRSTSKAGGSTTTALMVLLATAITAPILIPLWATLLARLTPYTFAVDAGVVLRVLVPAVVVPFVLGRIIQAFSQQAAVVLAKIANVVFIAGILLAVIGIIANARELLVRTPLLAYVAVAAVTFASAVLGYLAGGPRPEDRTALTYAAALGNPALALAIVGHTAPSPRAMPVIGLLVLARAILLVPVGLWLRAPRSWSAADRAPQRRDARWTTTPTHATRARSSHHARS